MVLTAQWQPEPPDQCCPSRRRSKVQCTTVTLLTEQCDTCPIRIYVTQPILRTKRDEVSTTRSTLHTYTQLHARTHTRSHAGTQAHKRARTHYPLPQTSSQCRDIMSTGPRQGYATASRLDPTNVGTACRQGMRQRCHLANVGTACRQGPEVAWAIPSSEGVCWDGIPTVGTWFQQLTRLRCYRYHHTVPQ